MRIVGGRHGGRDLVSPNDRRVRPTAEHVRAAVMDFLAAELRGARVLDLFAGTGALGLEALSRGAATCDFVESRPASLHALKANVVALRYRERTRIFKRDAIPFAADLPEDAYDIAFADPPYTSRMADRVLADWTERKFARLLVVETAADHPLPPGSRRMVFDETAVTVYRLKKGRTRSAAKEARPVGGTSRPEAGRRPGGAGRPASAVPRPAGEDNGPKVGGAKARPPRRRRPT